MSFKTALLSAYELCVLQVSTLFFMYLVLSEYAANATLAIFKGRKIKTNVLFTGTYM